MAGVREVAVVEVAASEHAMAFITEIERSDGDGTLHAIVFLARCRRHRVAERVAYVARKREAEAFCRIVVDSYRPGIGVGDFKFVG